MTNIARAGKYAFRAGLVLLVIFAVFISSCTSFASNTSLTQSFVYTDADTGMKFTVPDNWK